MNSTDIGSFQNEYIEKSTSQKDWGYSAGISLGFLCPLTCAVDYMAIRSEHPKAVECLQYLAVPLERIIQSIAMPIFIVIHHFGNIKRELIWAKRALLLIKLPLHIIGALVIAVPLQLIVGCIQFVVPFEAGTRVMLGKEGAEKHFEVLKQRKAAIDAVIRVSMEPDEDDEGPLAESIPEPILLFEWHTKQEIRGLQNPHI